MMTAEVLDHIQFSERPVSPTRLRDLAAHFARVLLGSPALLDQRAQCYPKRGAGNAGRWARPQPRAQW